MRKTTLLLALLASTTLHAETVDFSQPLSAYADFTVTGGIIYNNHLTNLNPDGTFITGLTFYYTTITFAHPVYNVSFEYNFFGIPSDLRLDWIDLPVDGWNLNAWLPYSLNGPLTTLSFAETYTNVRWGLDNLHYDKVIATPGPMAGTGLPALLVGLFAWRRNKKAPPAVKPAGRV